MEYLLESLQDPKLTDQLKIEMIERNQRYEVDLTEKYYTAFRKKLEKLNIDKIMENEKSFCFFGEESMLDQSVE